MPSPRLENLSRSLPITWTIGVTASKNVFPIGAIETLSFSIDSLKLTPTEFSKTPNSRSDNIASSSIDAPARSKTLAAWVPSFVTFWNKVDSLENWNLPNSCSIARARFKGSRVSNALEKSITVFLMFPLLVSTIALMFTPSFPRNAAAFSDGLIKDARPDFKALAPSDALIPPSFIAVKKKARSSTDPPNCWTTGPALGIASVKSSIDTTVWFSTALRKLILLAKSSAATPKAFVTDIVVSSACSCSTPPRTARRVACATWAVRSAPVLPIAAALAAISIVSVTATPYFVNSLASCSTSAKALLVWSVVVNISP